MAQNDDDSSQMSIDIQNSLLKILDFNEDEEEENTSTSNKLSNKTSDNKKKNSKVRDNISDYSGHRTPISNIDNKSMNSNQDQHIGLYPDDGEKEDMDPSSNYFNHFVDKDFQLFGLEQDAGLGKISCNLFGSDRFNDERPIKLPSDGLNEFGGEIRGQARNSDEYGCKNVVFYFARNDF